jgi:Zn-dependent M28 family amino/carboxypeptidase
MRSAEALSVGIGLVVALLASMPTQRSSDVKAIIGAAHAAGAREEAPGEGAFRHLRALQDIALANGGNRAAGTPGYDRSADYVAERLKEAGYTVRFEEFDFPFFEERTPAVLSVSTPERQAPAPAGPVRTLSNSGSGDVTAPLRAVHLGLGTAPPAASTSGCDAADFQNFDRGSVALIRRGTCTFQIKVENAVAAGATAVIIMNEGTEGRTDLFSGQLMQTAAVAVVGVSYEFGRSLERAIENGASVHLAVDVVSGRRRTRNVLAGGNAGAGADGEVMVLVGAHLDSVPEGPGINDNGSGTAAVLETALQLAPEARRGVEFAFWGAEERGLIGSRHHVGALSEDARHHIGVYINLDMVGSPNFVRFIQGSTATSELAGVAKRELLADIHDHALAVEERSGGRYGTDDSSFSEKGVPTVGLYTGAGGSKSEAQAALYGGTAGRPYDACYHRACDTIANIDREVLEQNTHALMHALKAVTSAITGASPRNPGAPAARGP